MSEVFPQTTLGPVARPVAPTDIANKAYVDDTLLPSTLPYYHGDSGVLSFTNAYTGNWGFMGERFSQTQQDFNGAPIVMQLLALGVSYSNSAAGGELMTSAGQFQLQQRDDGLNTVLKSLTLPAQTYSAQSVFLDQPVDIRVDSDVGYSWQFTTSATGRTDVGPVGMSWWVLLRLTGLPTGSPKIHTLRKRRKFQSVQAEQSKRRRLDQENSAKIQKNVRLDYSGSI